MHEMRGASFALVTPWPPQRSGIADYALSLHRAMQSTGLQVDVFTNSESAQGVRPIHSVEQAIADLKPYSRVLFQLGNHHFYHGYMVPMIAAVGRRRCVVELHDLKLSHLLEGVNYHSENEFEADWLSKNYPGQVQRVDDAHPVSDRLCRFASDVIVHSNFTRTRLSQLGVDNVSVVDLAYDLKHADDGPVAIRQDGPVRIGVFGTFQKNRQIPLIIGALGILRRHGVTGWTLVLGGRRSDGFEEIVNAINAFDIQDQVEIHENLAPAEFISLIKGVDVHVALRNPTYGETSGVVVQGLALAIPTIVSNVGWYSELPEFVAKVPATGGLFELADKLRQYLRSVELRNRIRIQTAMYASAAYDVNLRAREIVSIINAGKENK